MKGKVRWPVKKTGSLCQADESYFWKFELNVKEI